MREGITRSRQNRIFGGVASGLGEYLSIDPIVVRVLFVVSVLLSGIGILLYLIMWIVIPEEKNNFDNIYGSSPKNNENVKSSSNHETSGEDINYTFYQEKNKNGKLIFGIVLIIIGTFFLGIEVFSFINFADLLPVILIGLGITLLWKSKNK